MEKKIITKKDWQANFNLIGVPRINEFSFKIDAHSEKSDWVYNSLNLGVDCGEAHGSVYCELMGGYSEGRDNVIYCHSKNEDGTDNFSEKVEVAWEDRFNDDVLECIGDLCFITIGIEKTTEGKTFYKKFLSAYDAIAYVNEHLSSDMVVNVKGNLKYSTYNDNVQIRKNITSIALSKVDDPSKYKASFTQTVLIDKDSASLKNVDKDKGVMFVDTKVLDYIKELNGVEVKGQYPYDKEFEFALDLTNPEQCKKIVNGLFKVKKGYTQITFKGDFVEGGAVVTATMDDVPDEIKQLIDMGLYSEEEALAKCSSNGSRERRMVLKKPVIKLVGEEKTPVLQKFDERYTEEDLIFDIPNNDEVPFEVGNSAIEDKVDESPSELDWLSQL